MRLEMYGWLGWAGPGCCCSAGRRPWPPRASTTTTTQVAGGSADKADKARARPGAGPRRAGPWTGPAGAPRRGDRPDQGGHQDHRDGPGRVTALSKDAITVRSLTGSRPASGSTATPATGSERAGPERRAEGRRGRPVTGEKSGDRAVARRVAPATWPSAEPGRARLRGSLPSPGRWAQSRRRPAALRVGWLPSGGGLIGSRHGLEHTFDRPTGRADSTRGGGRGARRPGPRRPGRRRPGRASPGAAAAAGPAGRPVAARTGRWLPLWPPAPSRASRSLDRWLAAAPGCAWAPAPPARGADRPGGVPRPPAATGQGLDRGGALAPMPRCSAHGTHDLPAAHHRRGRTGPGGGGSAAWTSPRLRRVIGHLRLVADPDGETSRAERLHQRRGLWLSPTIGGMVALDGLLEAEAGQTVLAALEPLARPAAPRTPAAAASGRPTPWWSWPAAPWRAAGCPRPAGSARR